jgi:tetratricopeptide (TPR) repeat protein
VLFRSGLRHIALLKGDIPTYMRATQAIVPHLTGAAVAKSVEILLDLGHEAEAREIVAAADQCGKEGDELDALRLLVYQAQGRAPGSQEDLYRRLSALPAPPDGVLRALVRYDYARGDFAGAKRHFSAIGAPDPSLQERYVRTLLALGDTTAARGKLLEYLAAQPGHNGFLFLLAELACRDGNHDDARKYLVAALEQGFGAFDEIARNPELKLIYESLTVKKETAGV